MRFNSQGKIAQMKEFLDSGHIQKHVEQHEHEIKKAIQSSQLMHWASSGMVDSYVRRCFFISVFPFLAYCLLLERGFMPPRLPFFQPATWYLILRSSFVGTLKRCQGMISSGLGVYMVCESLSNSIQHKINLKLRLLHPPPRLTKQYLRPDT